MNSRSKKRRGFTLIEILLVLGIIVMLAGVTAVILWPQAQGAKIDIAKAQMAKLSKQLDLYNMNIGHYPTDEEGDLNALVTRPAYPDEKVNAMWRGPYLSTDDLNDPWNNKWVYELNVQTGTTASGAQAPFKLHSNGPNSQAGDDDDIKNWSDTTTP